VRSYTSFVIAQVRRFLGSERPSPRAWMEQLHDLSEPKGHEQHPDVKMAVSSVLCRLF